MLHTHEKTGNGQKAGSTGADLHEEDMMGTGDLYKSAACNLMFSRDKEAEDPIERNTTTMKATKLRWTGKTGVAGKYYYDLETHTMWDLEDWLKENGTGEFLKERNEMQLNGFGFDIEADNLYLRSRRCGIFVSNLQTELRPFLYIHFVKVKK